MNYHGFSLHEYNFFIIYCYVTGDEGGEYDENRGIIWLQEFAQNSFYMILL